MENIYHAQASYPKTSSPKNAILMMSGLKDAVPIAMGYFTVAFSLGIAAKQAGLSVFQGFFASLLTLASAGEYSVFALIAIGTTCLEIMMVTLIVNARYFLMSCSLSQQLPDDLPIWHRFLLGFSITDEVFSLTLSKKGAFSPYYCYGACSIAAISWALGTACGVCAGELLPAKLVIALGAALYGMFISAVVPAAKENRDIAILVAVSALASLAFSTLPYLGSLSQGMKIVILTLVLSAGAAIIRPIPDEEASCQAADQASAAVNAAKVKGEALHA